MRRLQRFLFIAALTAFVIVLVVHYAVRPARAFLRIATGYAAVVTAMDHFASGDDLETIRRDRFPSELGFIELELDREAGRVTASAWGFESRARFRPGIGATREEVEHPGLPAGLPRTEPLSSDKPWPVGEGQQLAPLFGQPAARLEAAIEAGFVDPDTGTERGTRAILVVHEGRLVAERYARGYDRFTPLLSWSMTKSVTATLVGRLVYSGKLSLSDPPHVPEWVAPADPRGAIGLEDLLRMRSGLAWFQNHDRHDSDSLRMLFVSDDCGAVAAAMPLEHEPGAYWAYSDGTSNILARLVRQRVSLSPEEAVAVPRTWLFEPLDMRSAFIAVDGTGTFIGSSLMYASARDWARFGQFILQDGQWNGKRLLPPGWVDLMENATPESENRCYGAGFWRFDGQANRDANGALHPRILDDVFYASGYQGQFLFLHRVRRLVVVRLGTELEPGAFDPKEFLAGIFAAFEG